MTSIKDINQEIAYLRSRKQHDFIRLKSQYDDTLESLKPTNMVKSALHNVLAAPDLKSTALKATIGFATAYVSKILYAGQAASPLKNGITQIVQLGLNYFSKKKF